MANIIISTQDQHHIEEQKHLLNDAISLIEDLSVGLDNPDLEDDVAEFLYHYETLKKTM
jgi:hypothetical protein